MRRARRGDGSRRLRRTRQHDPVPVPHRSTPDPLAEAARCRFSRSADLWTLQGDCTAISPVELPGGVSLDGNGKTITLAGSAERFESAAVHLRQASVRDLVIDGQQLAPRCSSYLAALVVSGPGSVENVTVANVQFAEPCVSAIGIELGVFDGGAASLTNVTVANVDGAGILLTGDGQVTIAGATVHNGTTGIQVMNTIEASISGVAVGNVSAGVVVTGHARARIDSRIAPSVVGGMSAMDNALASLGNLTLAGFGSVDPVLLDAPRHAPESAGRAQDLISSLPRQSGRS